MVYVGGRVAHFDFCHSGEMSVLELRQILVYDLWFMVYASVSVIFSLERLFLKIKPNFFTFWVDLKK